MAQATAPMACTEVTNLANLGISQSSFTFTNATMESEDAIVVREESGASPTLCVVDPKNPASPLRRPISAESCIMSPLKGQKVLALRASANGVHQLQVFNLDTKARIGQHQMTEAVVFWKWISEAKIGIVTATAVFHWDPKAGEPVKVFDRTQNLAGSQIISYRVTPDEKWSALVGILPGSGDRPQLVRGAMQLHSVEQGRSQPLEAQAASFSTLKVGAESKNVIVFAQKTVADGQINSKLHIIELGAPSAGRQPLKKQAELFFPQEFADDFPVSLQVSEKYMLVYVITKFGLLFVYDLETATAIYRNRISQDPIFLACGAESTGGFYAIARTGRLLHGNVNPQGMVPFISNQLQNLELALAMAKRGGLPGADQLVQQQYRKLVQEQKFAEAAVAAAESPQGLLRTQQVVAELKQLPAQPGGKPPILVYFGTLLQKGTLNAHESVEMATMVFPQGKFDMLKTWWREGKLTASEQLADAIVNHPQASQDAELVGIATEMYKSAGAHQKVVMAYAAQGDIEQMMAAAGRAGQAPDYMFLLQSLMGSNPEGAVALAKRIAKETPPPIDINSVTDLFLQRRMIKECTSFLVEALEGDKPEHAHLQTKLLEINLITQPQIADAIMANTSMTHYDRPRIAQLCEKAGLYMRALQHYTDLPDIKRCIINTSAIDPKALTEYFGSLSADWALECLREILSNNLQMNTQLVVDVAKEYTEQLGVQAIMEMFEAFHSWQGLFLYLGSRIHTAEDPEEHYKYIESAARIGQIREVERHTRESSSYPPEKVKNLLMDMKLPDARPLINVCDRFDMVGDLTTYLYHNNLLRYIEGYVQKVNSNSTPKVVGALLDVEAPEDFIQNLILSVRALVPVEPLVEEIEARNLLKMLLPFLEHLISEGSTDSAVHNALGKIIVDTNQNPEHFLKNNEHYEPLVVGKYCEKRDPHLAVVAYRRGLCDDALVDCTNRHSLFKLQSRYVVERQDAGLWAKVLDEENPFRRQLIDQVVSTALPECTEPERVSTSVKAFMEAGLQAELIELLEKIVLQNSAFSSNRNLQNLLIITAIKSDQTRVKDYVRRLDQFDGIAVGEIAVEKGLHDEAFEIYKKFHENVLAIRVLLENLGDLDRAYEFASKVDDAVVWSELGNAQLTALQVPQAIESFLRAADSTKYQEVITGANQAGCFRELVNYLLMARKKVKDPIVDSELVYAYAQTGDQNDLEAFLAGPHQANLQQCGDRCFREGLYESARVLFSAIPNWGRLASTLVRLRHFNDAVDAARKANNPKVWKEVCFACVEEREFRLAQLCALNIIINADDLDEVSEFYQRRGHFEELMALMESGIGLERAHMGIFTELGMLFARYRPESLMEHLKLFSNKINVPRLIRICEDQQLWKELTFLYVQYDEFDNAASVMIMHPVAWDHVYFKDVCVKVSNVEVYYRALTFYLDQHPGLLTDLLKVLEARVDHARVVDIMHKADQLALVKEYLLTVQKHNMVPVNEAVNELLIEEEDFQGLRTSIETYENFDMQALASELESHELIEFRRIAAYLYKKNLKWQKAVELAKRDSLYKDAMETAAQSEDGELVEELLRYFVSEGQQECFAAALYTCYDHIKPDVVLELAWMHGLMDLIMPFMIQFLKEYVSKVDLLMSERKETAEKKAEEEETVKQQEMVRNAMINMPLALEYNVAAGGGGMPDPNMTGGGYPGGPPPAGGFAAAPPGYDAAYAQQGVPAYPPQGYGM